MIGRYDYRATWSLSTAQLRLDYWQRVKFALDAQEFADAIHGRETTPVELGNAITAIVDAHIRFAQAQLNLAKSTPENGVEG